jgi:hypothetical protein
MFSNGSSLAVIFESQRLYTLALAKDDELRLSMTLSSESYAYTMGGFLGRVAIWKA